MKIALASDLHLEFRNETRAEDVVKALTTDADVLVLAGDVFNLRFPDKEEHLLAAICESQKLVLFVPGNHEYYGTDIQSGDVALNVWENKFSNFKVLRSYETMEIQGKRFLGDTMWFPYDEDNDYARRMISDFSQIQDIEPTVYEEHNKFSNYLKDCLQEGDIVVTHHTPSPLSVPPRFYGSPINPFFCVPAMHQLIEERKPALWLHGHTHDVFDYRIGPTRVVCNPAGYPYEYQEGEYNPKLIIEV